MDLLVECVACREEHPAPVTFKSTCSHNFCTSCLHEFFRNSLTEAKFPAKCCGRPIPEEAWEYLDPVLAETLGAKKLEYSIPMAERVFCRGCATILLPETIDVEAKAGYCKTCDATTCTTCKGFGHSVGEEVCPGPGEDENSLELKKLSHNKHWVACYKCDMLVEKSADCDHITCLCGAEFCYQCSARWKTCACYHPEFNYFGPTNANFRSALAQGFNNRDGPQPFRYRVTPRASRPAVSSMTYAHATALVNETQNMLALRAPKPPPLFPKRDWTCSHRSYYCIHRDSPFNCADCAVIHSRFILQCKKCGIQLCCRCADLYEDFDWWGEDPLPRGRSNAARGQVRFD